MTEKNKRSLDIAQRFEYEVPSEVRNHYSTAIDLGVVF